MSLVWFVFPLRLPRQKLGQVHRLDVYAAAGQGAADVHEAA